MVFSTAASVSTRTVTAASTQLHKANLVVCSRLSCVFVFMPNLCKANVINEIARTLKPGGKAIVVDATQPEFDGAGVCTLDRLPSWGQMTPTYRAYLKSDLEYSLIKVRLGGRGG